MPTPPLRSLESQFVIDDRRLTLRSKAQLDLTEALLRSIVEEGTSTASVSGVAESNAATDESMTQPSAAEGLESHTATDFIIVDSFDLSVAAREHHVRLRTMCDDEEEPCEVCCRVGTSDEQGAGRDPTSAPPGLAFPPATDGTRKRKASTLSNAQGSHQPGQGRRRHNQKRRQVDREKKRFSVPALESKKKHAASHPERAERVQAPKGQLGDIKLRGSYLGPLATLPLSSYGRRILYVGNARIATLIYDRQRRLAAVRTAVADHPDQIDSKLRKASARLKSRTSPSVQAKDNKRGKGRFESRMMSLHRGSCGVPNYNKFCRDFPEATEDFLEETMDVQELIAGMLPVYFPAIDDCYETAYKIIAASLPGLRPVFGKFASVCINSGDVSTDFHTDGCNLGHGVCGVGPFQDFDPRESGRVILEELGLEVELRPGQFLFFPSALITHGNTPLQPGDTRESIVVWTGATVIQYADLGCKAVRDLNKDEKKKYEAEVGERLAAGLERFPVYKGVAPLAAVPA